MTHVHSPKPRWRHFATAAYLGVVTLAVVLIGTEQHGIEERIVRVEQDAACARPDSQECRERLTIIVRALESKQACIILRKAGVRCTGDLGRSKGGSDSSGPGDGAARPGDGQSGSTEPAAPAPDAPGSAAPTTPPNAPPSGGAPPGTPPVGPPGMPPAPSPPPPPSAPGGSSIDVLPGHPLGPVPCVDVGLATVNC